MKMFVMTRVVMLTVRSAYISRLDKVGSMYSEVLKSMQSYVKVYIYIKKI